MSVLDDRGRAGAYRVIGAAAGGGEVAAAGGKPGAFVAWEGTRGAVRVIRRGTASTLRFGKTVTARRASGADLSGMTAALDPNGIAYIAWREGSGSRTQILVARAKPGRKFTVDQVAAGAGLGKPSITSRPIGGSIVGYAAASGWQARKVPTTGGLPIQSTVSAPGTSTAVPLARPFLSAGPGPHADMAWLQPSAGGCWIRRNAEHRSRPLIARPARAGSCLRLPRDADTGGMARLPARVAPRLGALLVTALAAAGVSAATAGAWSSPSAIYANTAPQVLAVAGDPAGNAFAVYQGGTPRRPAAAERARRRGLAVRARLARLVPAAAAARQRHRLHERLARADRRHRLRVR